MAGEGWDRRCLELGVPRGGPAAGMWWPPRGSEDPETESGRRIFGGSRLGSVELPRVSLLPSHEIWNLDGFGMGEAVVIPVTPGDPGPDVTPSMRHRWGCQGARASPGARGHEGVRRLHPMGILPWGCCLSWAPVQRWMGAPLCSPGLQVQPSLGCTSCRGLLGFEGEPDGPCQPLQGGLGDLQ